MKEFLRKALNQLLAYAAIFAAIILCGDESPTATAAELFKVKAICIAVIAGAVIISFFTARGFWEHINDEEEI